MDGTVECFAGGHLALTLVAALVLIFYILLIVFVMAVVMKKIKVEHLVHCFSAHNLMLRADINT